MGGKYGISEDHVEQAALQWLAAIGWEVGHGPDISPPDAKTPGSECDTYREVVLRHRLRDAIQRLNPHIPPGARDEAARMGAEPQHPGQGAGQPPDASLAGARCPGGVSEGRRVARRPSAAGGLGCRDGQRLVGRLPVQRSGAEANAAARRRIVLQWHTGGGSWSGRTLLMRMPTSGRPSTSCRPTRKTSPTCS